MLEYVLSLLPDVFRPYHLVCGSLEKYVAFSQVGVSIHRAQRAVTQPGYIRHC